MSNIIKEIKLQDKNYSFINNSGTQGNWIQFLSKINIFVGENNSGKSRLLRSLLSNELDYIPSSFVIADYNKEVEALNNEFGSYFKNIGIKIKSFKEINDALNAINKIEFISESINLSENFSKLKQSIKTLEDEKDTSTNGISHPLIAEGLFRILETKKFDDYLKSYTFKRIYIPILRGMEPVNYVNNTFQYEDVYNLRIKENYFKNLNDSYNFEIFTGMNLYNTIKDYLLGYHNQRKLISEHQNYLSGNFFDSKEVTLIPSQIHGVVTVKIGDEKERPIYELGDGIQSIIILTLPLFLNNGKNLLMFLEEPEKLLHPGLQRKLIETFLKQPGFENCQYFVTTHSNHFLDITLDFPDISIYTLRKKIDNGSNDEKEPHFFIENLAHGDFSALELLGVRNSSVFLSNCTIWVEGITDRLYFRHYLNLYFDHLNENHENPIKFREDFHYSFVEYSGGNITHWSFLDNEENPMNAERLCGKLFLIADKDQGKVIRHEKLDKKLGDRFCLLNCREVENLISKKVLLKIIKDYEGCYPDTDFEEKNYINEPLGRFINKKLGDNKKRNYAEESGTITNKLGFCKKAIEHTEEFKDLSDETKLICEKICRFINENNGYETNI